MCIFQLPATKTRRMPSFIHPRGRRFLPQKAVGLLEAHEFAALFVVEVHVGEGDAKGVLEGHGGGHLHQVHLLLHLGEEVVGDLGGQVVDVVEADVPGEPLQDPGELEVGAPLHGGLEVLPAGVVLPVGVLKLVLHVEEEDAHHTGEVLDGEVDEEKGLEAEAEVDARPKQDQEEVGEGHRSCAPRAFPSRSPRAGGRRA